MVLVLLVVVVVGFIELEEDLVELEDDLVELDIELDEPHVPPTGLHPVPQ